MVCSVKVCYLRGVVVRVVCCCMFCLNNMNIKNKQYVILVFLGGVGGAKGLF